MAIEMPPPIELRACFRSPLLDVMDFLNEAALRYPDAISFAPGRPHNSTIAVGPSLASLERFVGRRAAARGVAPEAVMAEIGQYHRTAGIVNELIAGQLLADEGIAVRP